MKYIYKYLLVLAVNVLFYNVGDVFSQSYDIEKIDSKLCAIYHEDQHIRKQVIAAMQKPSIELVALLEKEDSIDTRNQKYVSNLLDNYGWPDNLSDTASSAIFLVIDHSDKSYSEKYLEMAKEKADQGIISKSDAATLEDRLLMWTNKPQIYGTQTKSNMTLYVTDNDDLPENQNVAYIWPIEDPENVDKLRASVGLDPLNTYIKKVEDVYQMKVVWDKSLKVRDFKDKKLSKKVKKQK